MSGYHATSSHDVSAPASSLDAVSLAPVLDDVSAGCVVSSPGAAVLDEPLPAVVSVSASELPELAVAPPAHASSASTTIALDRLSRGPHSTIPG